MEAVEVGSESTPSWSESIPGRAKGLFCATEECDRVWESTGLYGETSVRAS
jgi:hypothetical protein